MIEFIGLLGKIFLSVVIIEFEILKFFSLFVVE